MSHPPPRRIHAITVSTAPYLTIVVCALLLVAVSACGGEDPGPQQTTQEQEQTPAAAEPEPTAEPQQQADQVAPQPEPRQRTGRDPLLIQIDQAQALERNGFWEQAAALRQSALEDQSLAGLIGTEAVDRLRLDQVRLLLRLRRPAEAEQLLFQLQDATLPPELGRCHALLAAALGLAVNELGPAGEAVERYVALDGPAFGPVLLKLARRMQTDDPLAAAGLAERALGDEWLPLQSRRQALWLIARALDDAGEVEAARERFEQFFEISTYEPDRVYALSRIGALSAELGDSDTAVEAWETLVRRYPPYAVSWEALDQLAAIGEAVDPLTAGIVLIEAGRYQEARSALLTVLGNPADAGEAAAAEFYIADIHQRQDDFESARLGYEATIGRDPSSAVAAESLMRLAEFALDSGDGAAAEERWERVVREHPGHIRAAEAAWRWSWSAVERGEWPVAARRFLDAETAGAEVWELELRQRLLFWSALTALEAGDAANAQAQARRVIELRPERYYALRAALLIDFGWPALGVSEAADSWLAERTGEIPALVGLEEIEGWTAARELRRCGFHDSADAVLSEIIEQAVGAWALYSLADQFAQAGEAAASARAGSALLRTLGVSWPDAPKEIVELVYPHPWKELIERELTSALEADPHAGPLLLWALIRRESFYDPDASGLAGEVGLTQVIPATGGDIASALGLDYEHADLARPQLAIRFGSAYLGWQLEQFERPAMALAAYNAGPGNAARWLESAEALSLSSLEDAFLAVMDFTSTQAYVRYVIESWSAYWALAASERAP